VYDGEWSSHRQKIRGRNASDLPSHSFVIAAQNHDQVGNRPAGDRMSALVDEGSLKAAAALLLTSHFTPMLFQGEEWAASSPFQYFTDHADPELGFAVRAGRRRDFAAFGWPPEAVPDPQDRATFDRSKLVWDQLDEPFHLRMLDWYRALIALRRQLPVRRDSAGIHAEVDDDARRIVFERDGISVRVNLGKGDWFSPIPGGVQVLMASDTKIRKSAGSIWLPPSSVVILETPAADV
jgi:maltooligosyltrehalose trehalohydrolase